MSIAAISYGSLKDAAGESRSVAKKLNRYADSIQDTVYQKLNRYNGSWSSNLSTAKSKANEKILALRAEAGKYRAYASDLDELQEECVRTDKSVRARISQLTDQFKKNNGIKNSQIENAINFFITGWNNSTATGRWISDKKDAIDAGKDYIKETIKDWYDFEGGEDLIKGIAATVLGVAAAVIALVLGGCGVLAVIGVIFAVVNGMANLINEFRAYQATQNDDPATGKRLSSLDKLSDTIREESDDPNLHAFANGLDISEMVYELIDNISNVKDLLKNGFKWATGSIDDLKDIGIKDILSKETRKDFGKKICNGAKDIGCTLRERDWSKIKNIGGRILTDFKVNLNKEYFNFDTDLDGLRSAGNLLDVAADIIEGGADAENMKKVGIQKILLPGISAFHVTNLDVPDFGQIAINIDSISLNDIYKIFDKFDSLINRTSPFTMQKSNHSNLLLKMSAGCDINLSVPDTYVPKVNFNYAA